ncbi:Alpha/beta hydrolase fold-1 [Dillenia turbinata]|uniref:Alpha/beta hydrolase fold-1 n=1 Tax=Dillenia turbinata TaxID=194707 RepID=A0AAN8UG49_9MAGN
MALAKGGLERVRRCVWTIFFMFAMVISLLVSSAPVLVAIGDILVPCASVSSFVCIRCHSFREHLHIYAFNSSLLDIPLVSILRSLIITCVYSFCDGPALSHGPYLGTVTLCSIVSIVVLSVKVCVFTTNAEIEAEASSSLSRQKLHLKKSWGMPVLFLSSVVFALGHTVVAYRTSCRARRKLLFHRVDPEAVLSGKNLFSGYQKVPRSPTPSTGKTSKSDSETRRKPFGTTRDERDLPIRLLADLDSLFMPCQGLTLHYKLCKPNSPCSLFSTNFDEHNSSYCTPKMSIPRLKVDRAQTSVKINSQYQMHRSFSNRFQSSPLFTPLLASSATHPDLPEDIPVFSLDDGASEDDMSKNSLNLEHDIEGPGDLGIVLLHGFGGGVFSWRYLMPVLAQHANCTVAAFDRPGWGLTSRPCRKDWEGKQMSNPYKLDTQKDWEVKQLSSPYEFNTQVDLLLSFCTEMRFSSVVLVGHDDGGLLALKTAQRVQGSNNSQNEAYVIIKGIVLLGVSLTREVVPAFARILLCTSLGKRHLVRPLLRTEITQVVNRHAWYDATKLTTDVLNLYKGPLCVEGWDEALHEIGRLSSETVLSPASADLLLKAVEDLPVLVVAGAQDKLVPLKSVQIMASTLVNSSLVAISGCGHLPHEECPKALLAALLPFISRLLIKNDLQNQ